MPRRVTPPTEAKPVVLTRVKMRTAIARLKQRILELQAFDPATVNDRDEPASGSWNGPSIRRSPAALGLAPPTIGAMPLPSASIGRDI
jgi:hypothetical protein